MPIINSNNTIVNQLASNSLNTTDKTLVGAINEINSLFYSLTISLPANNWVDNLQTIDISSITLTSTVWISPDPNDISAYIDARISAVSQTDGSITFRAEKIPQQDILVNLVIGNFQNNGAVLVNDNLFLNSVNNTIEQIGDNLIIENE